MEQTDLELLRTVPTYHLQAVARVRHIPLSTLPVSTGTTSTTPPTIPPMGAYSNFAQALFDPTALQHILTNVDTHSDAAHEHPEPLLNETALHILRELVACGGKANSRDLALYFGYTTGHIPEAEQSLQLTQSPQYPIPQPHGAFELAIRQLLLCGLLFWGRLTNFMGREYTSGMHDGVLTVPQSVYELGQQLWPIQQVQPLDDPQHSIVGNEEMRLFQRSLYLYWSFVASTKDGLSLINNGLLARTAYRAILEQLGKKESGEQTRLENDTPRLLFMRLLLLRLGLFVENQSTIVADRSAAETFFALPFAERVRRCLHLCVHENFWNELLYLPEVNIRPAPALIEPAHAEIITARRAVLDRLSQEPLNTTLSFSAFIARTKLHVPYLMFPRQYGARAERYSSGSNPYNWDFRLRRGWLTHREGWHMIEGGFIRTFMSGPLHWLGLVLLNTEEASTSFKLDADFPYFLQDQPFPSLIDHTGKLVVQPNFELVALAPVTEGLLMRLERFAERMSVEHIAQYRLTKASVTRAIQYNLRVDTIISQIEQAGGNLPQNVRYSLLEWERQARRIEIWPKSTLIEVDDSALLDRCFADDSMQLLFKRRLSPTLAEVAAHHVQKVQELFWQWQYLPALSSGLQTEAQLEQAEVQWKLRADGLLEPCYQVTHFYRQKEAELFCEFDHATGWLRLTAESVQRALTQNWTLEQIMQFLRTYCESVPGSLLIQLKLWGGGYHKHGQIVVERTPMLRLSAEVLADLRQDEAMQSLLGTEVEQEQRLVHIAEEHLPQVIAALQKRGFTVEE